MEKSKQTKQWTFLNSPFIVTLLGGVLLSLISLSWQTIEKKAHLANEKISQAREIKKQIFYEYTHQIPASLYSLLKYKEREMWIRENQHKKEKARLKFYDGRNFVETRSIYEKELEAFYLKLSPFSTMAKVTAMFEDKAIGEKVKELRIVFDEMIRVKSREDFLKLYDKTNYIDGEIIPLMGRILHESYH